MTICTFHILYLSFLTIMNTDSRQLWQWCDRYNDRGTSKWAAVMKRTQTPVHWLYMSHAITRYNFDPEVQYAFSHLRAPLKFQYYCWSKNFEGCFIPSVDILIEEGCCVQKHPYCSPSSQHYTTNTSVPMFIKLVTHL
jgi:hypothetical protein